MKNLRQLADSEILEQTKKLADHERDIYTQVLWHIREVERRRLFAIRGLCSLFEYVVKELRYSEAAAARRINAMRLLTELPEIEESIQNGSLNLSTVSTVQSFLNKEKKNGKNYSQEEKRSLVQSVKNKSKMETEKVLASLSPESVIPRETQRPVTKDKTEIRIVLTEEQLQKLEKIKSLNSSLKI